MLRSIWTHRFIVVLNAIVLGFIIDRLSHSFWWGFLGLFVVGIVGILKLKYPILLERLLGIDRETAAVLRSVVLAFVFFVECAIAAHLILA